MKNRNRSPVSINHYTREESVSPKNQVFGQEYASQYDIFYEDKNYEAECDLLEKIFNRYATTPVKSVLDLGCGTGNHAIPLAKRGYQVTGIDCSPEMITQAKNKSQSKILASQPSPIFLEGDVSSLALGQTFDAVIMMFAVLGYQLANKDVLAALVAVRDHLKEGGVFIFDIWYGPAVLAIRPGDKIKVISTNNGQVIRTASSRLDIRRHCCEVHYQLWQIVESHVVSESKESHIMRYFFPMEIEQYLSQTDMILESLTAFPDIEKEADESTWNVLGVGKGI